MLQIWPIWHSLKHSPGAYIPVMIQMCDCLILIVLDRLIGAEPIVGWTSQRVAKFLRGSCSWKFGPKMLLFQLQSRFFMSIEKLLWASTKSGTSRYCMAMFFTYDVPVPPNFLKLFFLLIKWRKPENQKSEMVSKGENESYELFSLLTTISH